MTISVLRRTIYLEREVQVHYTNSSHELLTERECLCSDMMITHTVLYCTCIYQARSCHAIVVVKVHAV
jgi:hypothetical protein